MVGNARQSRYVLANRILGLVREARFERGHYLREQQLGKLLGVSRTPVRAALGLLAEKGIVEAHKNHGFFLKAVPEDLLRAEVEIPVSADQDLYTRIVQDRLSGVLDESFTQAEIARRYGIDRALLQKTLTHMVKDGLLARNSGRGWSFLPTLDTQVALRNSYDFRLAIEPAAIRQENFKIDPAALERCRMQHLYLEAHPDIKSVDSRLLFETDAQFHEMIAEFSGNIFFYQALQQQNRLRRLLEFGGYSNRRRVRDWCREHLAILDAVAEGHQEEAAQLMSAHLSHAFQESPLVRQAG